ncbi:hypothetical protein ASPBRDRAFT_673345 [Aspergillus brasiliensis CBS 101740]|uniref:Uncharacterized protein n=1 Tax=Aspergillus brasiliensis (strain CBS 101740 / IMI 381727 / IBT 21946) TaxID=767769 RepID=A0A1L9UMF2_ASPBC|nr:hypothetical protein ASPBRDRAFT_673345 [Aspergillus brasiliensis CBS 101740]
MEPGPKSDAFRVSNRRVMPLSPSALNTNYSPRCSVRCRQRGCVIYLISSYPAVLTRMCCLSPSQIQYTWLSFSAETTENLFPVDRRDVEHSSGPCDIISHCPRNSRGGKKKRKKYDVAIDRISIRPREQLSSCYIELDTARQQTNTSGSTPIGSRWVDSPCAVVADATRQDSDSGSIIQQTLKF